MFKQYIYRKGGRPVIRKRTVSLIAATCFALNGLFLIPSFTSAESAEFPSSIQISLPAGADDTDNTTGSAVSSDGTAGDTALTTGTAINTTGSAVATDDEATGTTGAAVNTTGSAVDTTGSAVTATPGAISSKAEEESRWYIPQIAMKKEHQKLLWDYCKKREVDYIDMLALISLESNFDEKCSSGKGKYKGYFQISSGHFKNLATTLKTPNKPLDGAININWGTAMYSWILADKRVKGLTGKKLRDAALSIYQRGTGGYDRYGLNKSYLAKYYKKWDIIVNYYEANNKRNPKIDRSE
jgi:hypothetical protein